MDVDFLHYENTNGKNLYIFTARMSTFSGYT